MFNDGLLTQAGDISASKNRILFLHNNKRKTYSTPLLIRKVSSFFF